MINTYSGRVAPVWNGLSIIAEARRRPTSMLLSTRGSGIALRILLIVGAGSSTIRISWQIGRITSVHFRAIVRRASIVICGTTISSGVSSSAHVIQALLIHSFFGWGLFDARMMVSWVVGGIG